MRPDLDEQVEMIIDQGLDRMLEQHRLADVPPPVAGVQIGTRLIATTECTESAEYKQAIIDADEDDIVLTHRLTGVPVSVIKTARVEREGTEAGPLEHWLLTHPKIKHWVRALYSVRSFFRMKKAAQRGVVSHRDYLQAGKSVGGVHAVEPVAEIVARFERARQAANEKTSSS